MYILPTDSFYASHLATVLPLTLLTHHFYRQLVCFETPIWRALRHPAELVGDVFRALIPMFQNQEKSVITPLLATGDQVGTHNEYISLKH